ncbi:MAG: phosphatase PAP2 family protein [Candidatus Baltobacteraceae bacterium]
MNASIAAVAAWGLAVPLLLVAIATLRRNAWRIDIACGAVGGLATIALVKLSATFFYEPRPFVVEHVQPLVAHAADNAFPSDHLAACGLAVGYLWPRSKGLAVLALLSAVAIGVARDLAHLHYVQDLVFGFLFGVAGALFGQWAMRFLPFTRSGAPRSG